MQSTLNVRTLLVEKWLQVTVPRLQKPPLAVAPPFPCTELLGLAQDGVSFPLCDAPLGSSDETCTLCDRWRVTGSDEIFSHSGSLLWSEVTRWLLCKGLEGFDETFSLCSSVLGLDERTLSLSDEPQWPFITFWKTIDISLCDHGRRSIRGHSGHVPPPTNFDGKGYEPPKMLTAQAMSPPSIFLTCPLQYRTQIDAHICDTRREATGGNFEYICRAYDWFTKP